MNSSDIQIGDLVQYEESFGRLAGNRGCGLVISDPWFRIYPEETIVKVKWGKEGLVLNEYLRHLVKI